MAAALVVGGAANATTVDFTYWESGTPVANGSFSYPTGDTGVLGYGVLSAFSVTLAGVTYTLSDISSLPQYQYFAYDTAANDFDFNYNSCGTAGCGYYESLGAINDSYNSGFFFNVPGGELTEYSTGVSQFFDSITFSAVGVPEPGTWAMMMFGLFGIGALLRSRRQQGAALA